MKPREEMRRISTPDDWYPTYPDGTVRVEVIDMTPFSKKGPGIRVCVWGSDDYGSKRDEFFDTEEENIAAFEARLLEIEGWNSVTKKMLIDMGFEPA